VEEVFAPENLSHLSGGICPPVKRIENLGRLSLRSMIGISVP
jgi:hypothetical protein